MAEFSDVGSVLVKVMSDKTTFEYVCVSGKKVESYYSKKFEPDKAAPSGFTVVEIVAWEGDVQLLRMKVAKRKAAKRFLAILSSILKTPARRQPL